MGGIKDEQDGLVFLFLSLATLPKAAAPLAQPESDPIGGFQRGTSLGGGLMKCDS